MQRQLQPEQYEVKPPAGSIETSRFYIIEPSISNDGYTVQVRRIGDEKILWRCSVSFENSAVFQEYAGSAVDTMIAQAKSDLNNRFIK